MKRYRFKGLLQAEGWVKDATVTVDDQGLISVINETADSDVELIDGYAIPGFQNAHSHAFQYAMAGLAEIHPAGAKADNFWSWREAMYKLALTVGPDELEAIATMLYSEMVRHGYTHVAEFHYLHHDKDGKPYDNLAEHGERLVAAAQRAGIHITLVPMFYRLGGFNKEAETHQKRFISKSVEEYQHLIDASAQAVTLYENANLGYGIHSIRAGSKPDFEAINKLDFAGPFHIHIAEQLKEVSDSMEFYGQRPVQWLLDHFNVNDNCHLVHATHLDTEEITGIAKSGAHVVLCPSTEGNLGDGIFPLKSFQEQSGKWSIGTDSHIGLNPCEELRILDYGQRLISHERNTFVSNQEGDSGRYAVNQALLSGRQAMGNSSARYFEVGQSFDAVVYKSTIPLLQTADSKNMLSTIIYASDSSWNLGTLVNGKWVVRDGHHIEKDLINQQFVQAIDRLKVR